MDAPVQVALTAAVAGIVASVVTGIISPRVNWGIKKKQDVMNEKRERIKCWREMAHEFWPERSRVPFMDFLKGHNAYYSLQPYLNQEKLGTAYKCRDPQRANEEAHACLVEEIARIERDWDLI